MPMTNNDVLAGLWMFTRLVLFLVLLTCVLSAAWFVAGAVTNDWLFRLLTAAGMLAIWVSLLE